MGPCRPFDLMDGSSFNRLSTYPVTALRDTDPAAVSQSPSISRLSCTPASSFRVRACKKRRCGRDDKGPWRVRSCAGADRALRADATECTAAVLAYRADAKETGADRDSLGGRGRVASDHSCAEAEAEFIARSCLRFSCVTRITRCLCDASSASGRCFGQESTDDFHRKFVDFLEANAPLSNAEFA